MSGTITLVDRTVIKKSHPFFKECENICFLSKNLYNTTLYRVRQSFIFQKKYMNYYEMNRLFTHRNNPDYRALPAKVSKATMMLVDKDMKSFFALIKKKKNSTYDKPVKLPKYAHKKMAHYEKSALSFRIDGYVKLSKTEIVIPIRVPKESVSFARIVPQGNHYVIEVGYKKEKQDLRDDNNRYASIDEGVNNLIALSSNIAQPLIINGKPLKSMNAFYNKKIAYHKSRLPKEVKTSKLIQYLYRRRDHKIKNYIHKTVNAVVNYLVSNRINTLIIGKNDGWKQNMNIGKKNNQNFAYIPFDTLNKIIEYKCLIYGIRVVYQEESYTSKCSFMDSEDICKHNSYAGKRKHRGLFISSDGKTINADVNGAYNILKKFLIKNAIWNDHIWSDCIQVCSTPHLTKVTPSW